MDEGLRETEAGVVEVHRILNFANSFPWCLISA